jgi:hypothetical protein
MLMHCLHTCMLFEVIVQRPGCDMHSVRKVSVSCASICYGDMWSVPPLQDVISETMCCVRVAFAK